MDNKLYYMLEDYGVPGNYVRHNILMVVKERGVPLESFLVEQVEKKRLTEEVMEEIVFQILDIYYNIYESRGTVHCGLKPGKFVLDTKTLAHQDKEDTALNRVLRQKDIKLKLCNMGHAEKIEYDLFGKISESKGLIFNNFRFQFYLSPEYRDLLYKGGYLWKVKDAQEYCSLMDRFCIGMILLRVLAMEELPPIVSVNEKERL